MKHLWDRYLRKDDGNATVEFVMWLPVVLVLFGLTVDVSMVLHSQSQVLRIVQDANRNASIGRLQTTAEVEDYIESRLQASSDAADAVSSITAGVISTTVSYPARDFQILGFFQQFNSLTMNVNSAHMIENWGT
jgi:Flp pilus assembly protein TadG